MIKYELTCKNCNTLFDSWFASSKEYEKLKRLNHLNCLKCNSYKVEKSLMSPNISNLMKDKPEIISDNKFSEVKKKLKEYKKFIKNNFNYVGDNFTYEARLIHYKNKKKKNIYGKASLDEVKELKEEGIETKTIPWINDN